MTSFLKRKLAPAAIVLPVVALIVASIGLVEPILLRILCAVFCLSVFVAIPFARSLRMMFCGTTVIAVVLSVALTNWPIRALFSVSHQAFDHVADDVRNGNLPTTPCRVGLFRIRKAEVYSNNVVCLWTDLNPNGKSGFVQCPPENPPFNLWSHVPLNASWQFISED